LLVVCAFLLCFVGVHQHPLVVFYWSFMPPCCVLLVLIDTFSCVLWLYAPPCCALLVFIGASLLCSASVRWCLIVMFY
jgi:hypothetical protein